MHILAPQCANRHTRDGYQRSPIEAVWKTCSSLRPGNPLLGADWERRILIQFSLGARQMKDLQPPHPCTCPRLVWSLALLFASDLTRHLLLRAKNSGFTAGCRSKPALVEFALCTIVIQLIQTKGKERTKSTTPRRAPFPRSVPD